MLSVREYDDSNAFSPQFVRRRNGARSDQKGRLMWARRVRAAGRVI
jgi:hypothetical protein